MIPNKLSHPGRSGYHKSRVTVHKLLLFILQYLLQKLVRRGEGVTQESPHSKVQRGEGDMGDE